MERIGTVTKPEPVRCVSPPAKCATGKSRCQRTPVRRENILALQIARSQNKLRSKGVDATALFKRYLAIFVLDERNALESRTCTRHTDRASTDLPCAGRQPEFSAVAARSVAGLCRVRCAARKLCSDGRRGQRCTRPQDLLHCANKMRDHRRIQGRYARLLQVGIRAACGMPENAMTKVHV